MKRYAITAKGKPRLWPIGVPLEIIGLTIRDISDVSYARTAKEAGRLNKLAELEMLLGDAKERDYIIRKAKKEEENGN